MISHIYNSKIFEMACRQFDRAADILEMDTRLRERVINENNAPKLQCRILAEGANGPTTNKADAIISTNPDIVLIPDIICNSGGVIVSYFDWVQDLQSTFWTRAEVLGRLCKLLDRSKAQLEAQRKKYNCSRREAALTLGIHRVAEAKRIRGLFPYNWPAGPDSLPR